MDCDMSKKSIEFEKKVLDGLNHYFPTCDIIHTGNNSLYSDIKLVYNNYTTFVEAKIAGGQFGCPRLKYINEKWIGISDNPITELVSYILNNDPHAYSFMEYSKKLYLDKNYKHIMPTVSTFKNEPEEFFNYDSLFNIIKNIEHQYIYKGRETADLLEIIIAYYKLKNVDYIQISDNFYQINKNDITDIPSLKANVHLTVRLVNRKTKKWFEVVPTLKLKNLEESEYSILLNTKKKNPFEMYRRML